MNRNNYLEHLKPQSDKHQLSSKIYWITDQSQAEQWFNACDIALLCSHEEGFSNAIIEAMACGKPVIATDGGNPEAVIDQETGVIVPAKNPKELGKAIIQLSNNRALRQQYGQAGYARWQKHFSLEQCCQQYQQLYHQLHQEGVCVD